MKTKLLMLLLAGNIFSCQSPEQKSLDKVKQAEDALYGGDDNFRFDNDKAKLAIEAYSEFAKELEVTKKELEEKYGAISVNISDGSYEEVKKEEAEKENE